MPRPAPVLLWFRRDLRLADNPALLAAVRQGPVIAAYVHDPKAPWMPGAASRWWLHHSLSRLADALSALGMPFVFRRGRHAPTIAALAREAGVTAVHWNALYDPALAEAETSLAATLGAAGIAAHVHAGGALLHEPPTTLATRAGTPFQVFTPFWNACLERGDPPPPLPGPEALAAPVAAPESERLTDWGFLPTAPDWAGGLRATWTPGEDGAKAAAHGFLGDGLARYAEARDRPDVPGTSRLSPYLHFGEMSPRQLWHMACGRKGTAPHAAAFLRELGWREFNHHLLFHFPATVDQPLRPAFQRFPWRQDKAGFRAWTRGQTGYPIVDAGMRELWHSGFMHNRVRMIAASFLVKHLLVPWQRGAAWFWDTLVDADLANNAGNWQWVAGSGADAAPYFRIFNPTLQGKRFDPDGTYVRHWVPNLARMPTTHIHEPWRAPASVLAAAGIALGTDYPRPIVEHGAARARALDAFAQIRASSS